MNPITKKVMESDRWHDLLLQHGEEYLSENDSSSCLYQMDSLEEIFFETDAKDILQMAYGGGRWSGSGYSHEPFNPFDEYFFIDGYNHLNSVDADDYLEYIEQHIYEDGFVQYLVDNDYIDVSDYTDSEEDEEIKIEFGPKERRVISDGLD